MIVQSNGPIITKKRVFASIAAICFLAAIAAAVFFYLQYNEAKSNSEGVTEEKSQALIEKINKIYTLPEETPTVAEISNKEKLVDQPFFNNAENGDYLLVYPEAKQAIIYREEANKLINVGPVSISSDEEAKQENQ